MNEQQKELLVETQKDFQHIYNQMVPKSDRIVIGTTQKLEIIKESATPQPYEWEMGGYFALDGSNCGIENYIFVDESGSYKRNNHPLWVYVEFRNIKKKNPQLYYGCFYLPITVEKKPQVVGNIEGLGISDKKINNIKRFISGNVQWFQDIADQKIRGTKVKPVPIFFLKKDKRLLVEMVNFLKKMISVDDKGNPIPKQQSPNSTWKIKKGMTRFDISVVVSNSNQFNYVKNNELLCNSWFDEANPFQESGDRKIAFARTGSTWYQVDENGGVVKYMGENEI